MDLVSIASERLMGHELESVMKIAEFSLSSMFPSQSDDLEILDCAAILKVISSDPGKEVYG
jgi:hypothetical protein